MSSLYIVRAQPNPLGKDTVNRGYATNQQLNEEWIEFESVSGERSLIGDAISHLTFSQTCSVTGEDTLFTFSAGTLAQGHRIRLHTGRGATWWEASVCHMYLNRDWYAWNNACGDRATIRYQHAIVDSAFYSPWPPEGILERVVGTDRLEPVRQQAYRW